MKYAILGAGGMGLHFGILLQEVGYDVDYIDTWKPQVETIRKQHGVYVSRRGQGRHLVNIDNIYYPEEYHGKPDVVIPFTKQIGLAEMLERCQHFFNDDQYALTLMNGMGHIEKIDKYFPKEHVIGGTALIGSILTKPGEVDFVAAKGTGSCNLANQSETIDDTTKEIAKELTESGLNATIHENFMGTLLAKVIFNSVLNSLATSFQCSYGEFIASPSAKPLGVDLVNEAFDVFERAGIKLLSTREEEWQTIYHVAHDVNPEHYPSMYQDLVTNRPTEVEYINGYIYRLGLKYGYIAHSHKFAINLVHIAEKLHAVRGK
ncbi:ketopantoate reductase family protein (plasmid) [Nicoliella spurrieriana]|uniref:2-dehydropantoate 2-reductase n=1 Tax=Nicoliella spurrieriana TaxID=2925830 RepID=A0A976RQH8_9LACO|nr:ketopantoate reductase family protein [Nicoliella spurrieriana]UQS85999.1 ketopantoate reductase family protein [Nicoliella spurrieriana]